MYKNGAPPGLPPDSSFKEYANAFLNYDGNLTWWRAPSNYYMVLQHYCDFYWANATYPMGLPRYCDNDPLTYDERIEFCETMKPQYVYGGLVVSSLSLTDLCPWMDSSLADEAKYSYCLVFSDHPKYPNIGSFLSVELGSGASWNGKKFYYVPFKMSILSNIFTFASVANTLLSNHAGEYRRLTSDNFRGFSPAALYVYEKIAAVVGGDAIKGDTLNRLCAPGNPITPETLSLVHDIILLSSNPTNTSYSFVSLQGTDTIAPAISEYSYTDVWSTFVELSTELQYNDTEVTSAVPGVSVVVGTAGETTINQVRTCTRFQVDGSNVQIHGIVFDQSKCGLTELVSQTPIIFSGAFATYSSVYNITVIDSKVAVAVLGGNSIVYTFEPLISANGMSIYDVVFSYTSASSGVRNVPAVFARTVGVPTVASCPSSVDSGWGELNNCLRYVVNTSIVAGETGSCTATESCVDPNAPTCCSIDAEYKPSIECLSGYICGAAAEPNDKILCNPNVCNCGTPCITFVDRTTPVCAGSGQQ